MWQTHQGVSCLHGNTEKNILIIFYSRMRQILQTDTLKLVKSSYQRQQHVLREMLRENQHMLVLAKVQAQCGLNLPQAWDS